MGEFDGAIERGLDRRQIGGYGARPGYGDAREGFGDEEAVPGAELPGAVGMNVAGIDGGVDELGELSDAGLDVVGISPDKPEKLAKFRDNEQLTFPLLSDPDRKVLTAWGAYGEKKMYGKTVQGVIRRVTRTF